jgi:hypothetical protein
MTTEEEEIAPPVQESLLNPSNVSVPLTTGILPCRKIAGYLLPCSARPQSEKSAGNYLVMSAGH